MVIEDGMMFGFEFLMMLVVLILLILLIIPVVASVAGSIGGDVILATKWLSGRDEFFSDPGRFIRIIMETKEGFIVWVCPSSTEEINTWDRRISSVFLFQRCQTWR
jgi:type II secretory pathway component PulF